MIENYKRVYYKRSYYPPYKSSSNNIKVEVDLTNYATKNDLKNITHVDVSSFASKTNLAALKTEVDKIDTDKLKAGPADLAKLSNVVKNDVVKKTDYNTKVTSIEAQIAGDILALKNKLTQKEDTINENERGLSFNRGFFFYMDQSYLVYDCKMGSFGFGSKDISEWKSTGIYNYSSRSNMNALANSKNDLPNLKNDGRMHVHLSGNNFEQNKVIIPNNKNAINIYCVYKLDPIASNRDTTFTIQNSLFGAMQITKNTDTSKYNYKGYGICFDEGGQFGHTITEGGFTHTTNARNVLIFGADVSFSVHATNRANHIYVMGKEFIQGITDTTIYAEKSFYRNFTDPGKKIMLSLHYNGDDSYLFVNGRQELKFKCKTDQLVKEKLCIGNLIDQWTTSESEKTGLYGSIYDFVVDYEQTVGVKTIYDMHRYLMTKHNIKP